ncbi:MAG: phosphoglucosamine mutase [Deltaproteobacteria bacterium]|nr:phosphoglucosamine mutase [Deltaproteobacteria bacterium]
MGRLFGTDGIRGKANQYPMDGTLAFSLGQAVTHILGGPGPRPKVIVGRDTRISGPMLESALVAGILSMGGDALQVGVLPTPGIAYLATSLRADAGVMVSASHNPYEDNGLKIFSGQGFKLPDDMEEKIENLILGGTLPERVPSPENLGKLSRLKDAAGRYVEFLKQALPRRFSLEGMRLVLDTANGAAFGVAPAVFSELGADVHVINDQPDGVNINDHCGSQFTEGLQEQVIEKRADMGLAFDGDGDRLIAVDEKGNRLTGDQILFICALSLKNRGELKNDLLVSTVMSNLGLRTACRKHGIKHHASGVGDRYVLEDMRRLGAVIGGEESGHLIFLDAHTTGDGIFAGLRLAEVMVREKRPLSELAKWMEVFPQKLVNVEVRSKPDLNSIPEIVEVIRGAEAELGDRGRVLVRYSGTQDLCRVMVEGPTEDKVESLCRSIARVVEKALA